MLSRRHLVQGLGALALVPWSACGPALAQPKGPFLLGVASGDCTVDGIRLWTHYSGSSPLEVRVWLQGPGERTELVRSLPAPVGPGGHVHVEVSGLLPGARYRFGFTELQPGGAESPEGRFRTTPPDGALAPLRIGATSCTRYNYPFDVLARVAERADLDAFLWLGDTSYNDGAIDLASFRQQWARTLTLPEMQAARAAHVQLATWDDHEFVNDWAGERIDGGSFQAGREAFFEHMPVRRSEASPDRLWHSVRFGDTAEVFVLDSRGERKTSTRLAPDCEYLSHAQFEWLKRGLADSRAVFKLVMNSVPISSYPGAFFQTTVHDRWEGFPAQRTELLRLIEETPIPGVLFVAGDFHLASIGRVSFDGVGSRTREVLVGPGAQRPNVSPTYPSAPQCEWSSGINNYAVFDLDPNAREITVRYFDGADRELVSSRWTV